jgi:S1-C subfamily serine protease
VQGEIRGEGRDIYDRTAVNRDILVLSGRARPGNSGGPLVDLEGRMIGLVFAGSISRPDQSYALALGEVLPAIEAASTSSGRLDMRTYQCVS